MFIFASMQTIKVKLCAKQKHLHSWSSEKQQADQDQTLHRQCDVRGNQAASASHILPLGIHCRVGLYS